MNFTVNSTYRGMTGTKLKNGSWTGVFGKFQRKELDISTHWLLMSPERNEVVSFLYSLVTFRNYLFLKRPTDSWNWMAYIEPLHWNAWFSVSLLIFLASLAFYFISQSVNISFEQLYKALQERIQKDCIPLFEE